MDLPVIETPVFPRWVWMEEITYSHIIIATIITAFMVLAPIYEYIGYRQKDPRYDRLARSLIWFSLILFSPGAALGTGIPMFLIGTYPEFWSRWSNLFFWPLFFQFIFFLFEVFFLFFFYYLAWDALANRKRLHIFFGVMAATFGLLVQFVWDALGSYMSVPTVPLPGIHEPVAWSAKAFFGPLFPLLTLHRLFGNTSYTMLLVGGVFALNFLRKKDPNEKAYFGWAANLTFAIGFFAFFAQPVLGWFISRTLQSHSPVIFHAIMGGHVSGAFVIKMGIIGLMMMVAAFYVVMRYRSRTVLVIITILVAEIYVILHVHPPLDWVGPGWIWRTTYTVVLAGFLAVLWSVAGKDSPDRTRWQWAMFLVGLAATGVFFLGGFVRERSRSPWPVYGEIEKPEATPYERNRALTYDKCVDCHHASPADFEDLQINWAGLVRDHRDELGMTLTDDQARRIVEFLEEAYP